LGYFLYTPESAIEWLENVSENEIRITTGPCSRALRMKISALRAAIYWLLDQGLVESVVPERKRGTLIIKLKQPTNIRY
jgi:hypothetical protein